VGRQRSKARRDRQRRTKPSTPAIMEPPVNLFAAAHGDYGPDQVVDLGNELGDGRGRIHQVVRNRGGTTVERWLNAGSLTSAQAEAISLYARTWHMFIGEQRITANWGLCSFIRGMPASDWVQTQVEAKELILHIDEAIFKAMPPKYVDVWKNIVIFDKSADGAGREMLSGSSARSADVRAKQVVLFIADMIATVMRLGVPG
jgi:hypothetical protein